MYFHELLAKISGLNLITKELKFHHSCRRLYNKPIGEDLDDKLQPGPSVHERAIECIKQHVQITLIEKY